MAAVEGCLAGGYGICPYGSGDGAAGASPRSAVFEDGMPSTDGAEKE